MISIGGRIESGKMNGWGIQVSPQLIEIGNFIKGERNGDWIRTTPRGKYNGQFVKSVSWNWNLYIPFCSHI